MIKIAPAAKGAAQAFNRQPKLASMKRVAQPKTVAQPKMVAQSKVGMNAGIVKRPVAPPVYKPQPPLKTVQAKKVAPAQARHHDWFREALQQGAPSGGQKSVRGRHAR